ncbi:hypothetical protein J4526_01175 [Desulfurococcaceae archaeon MEX13E-LK6-19]|nr:hypothetical protein J4526_01175 [Desulfurococcaceae archaeon MEX13E-LK6-19]
MLIDLIAQRVIDLINKFDKEIKVSDYVVGLKYSYVEINGVYGRSLGVAITPIEDIIGLGVRIGNEPGEDNIVDLVSSLNPIEKTLGVALINALSNYLLWRIGFREDFVVYEDPIFSSITHLVEEPIVVIGNMAPLVNELQNRGFTDITVLERNPCTRYNCYPDTMAPRIIPKARTLIITGATLVNDTIDYILDLGSQAKKILIGPTANIYPKPLLDKGVNAILSMYPIDIDKVKKTIRLGGGRWSFYKYCKEYLIQPLD